MSKYLFPIVMICLNIGQAVVMAFRKDFISVAYWVAAAILNLTVILKQ